VANDLDDFKELPEREPAWMALERATACRKRLLAAGYLPLPVNGKAPPIAGWQDIEATNSTIRTWEYKYADATNTGILTRTVPAVDIDVLDPAVADELQELAERTIGASAVRTGQEPKRAMLFRVDAPFDKISTPVFVSTDGRTHKVEILCRGQQIVVHGIHPITHAPYTWRGGEPGPELTRDALPRLNVEKANEFITAAIQCMSAHGWTPKKKPNGDAAGTWSAHASERERAYAHAALDGCADEVAQAATGQRNDLLNKKAFRLGTMVARGWISSAEVFDALFAAAAACGLTADDGEEATRKTLNSGLDDGKKCPHLDLSPTFSDAPGASNSWKYHTGEAPASPRWLIKSILPETGAAIMSGQWGAFKTTVALDLSVCVMSNLPFAGRYHVKRHGAVLYFALEGEGLLSARLSAIDLGEVRVLSTAPLLTNAIGPSENGRTVCPLSTKMVQRRAPATSTWCAPNTTDNSRPTAPNSKKPRHDARIPHGSSLSPPASCRCGSAANGCSGTATVSRTAISQASSQRSSAASTRWRLKKRDSRKRTSGLSAFTTCATSMPSIG
jgi:hypothetical protein